MGYWYVISDANVHIPKENLGILYEKCFHVMVDRNRAYGNTEQIIPDNLPDLLHDEDIRFDVDTETGELHVWGGSSKYLATFPLMKAILSVAPDGSYVIWQGEEGGDFIRQIVRDGQVEQQQGRITFDY